MVRDLKYALRTLRRNPGFALVIVLSLALGIGANTAIFSVINSVMLRSLPIERAQDVFLLRLTSRTPTATRFSVPMFEHLRGALPAGSQIAGVSRIARAYTVFSAGETQQPASVQLVTGEFFPLIGRPALLGRTLNPDDNRKVGGHPVAVMSEGCWRRHYGASDAVLGRDVVLNGAHFTVVGVGPAGFAGVQLESPVDFWVPVLMQSDVRYHQNYSLDDANGDKPWATQSGIRWLDFLVRSPQNGPVVAALNVAFHQTIEEDAKQIGDAETRKLFLQQTLSLVPFHRGFSSLRDRFETPLYTLMAMVALVLLIACANTANLLLSRAASRQREIAVRLSIGAGRGRLIRQLLTESLLLVAISAALGLLLARWSGDLLVRMTLGVTTGVTPFSLALDGRILAFTVLLSLFTALLFGLAPAIRATRVDLSHALKQAGRSISGGSRLNAAKLLVAGQVALSMLLVVGALLFVRSLANLAQLNLGFERDHLLEVRLDPDAIALAQDRIPSLNQQILDRIAGVPGVRTASLAACGLISGCRSSSNGVNFSGYQSHPGEATDLLVNIVTPDYFRTVGMKLVAGREFNSTDTATSPKVGIINEATARRYFAGRSAVGERFGGTPPNVLIVGVIADARVNSVQEEALPMAYYPMRQNITRAESLDVRATGDPLSVSASVRQVLRDVAPDLPVVRLRTMTEQVNNNLNQERLIARLTTVFGALALTLACFGLYGVMSYAVSQRTAELGIRMALGATPSRVLGMVFGESLTLVGIGLAVGLPLVYVAGRQLSKILFRVDASDPSTMLIAAGTLLAVAAVSGYLPAWRASRVEPLAALRNE